MGFPLDYVLIALFAIVCTIGVMEAYPTGAPLSTCDTMVPQHSGHSPQSSAAPFTIALNATSFSPNDVIESMMIMISYLNS